MFITRMSLKMFIVYRTQFNPGKGWKNFHANNFHIYVLSMQHMKISICVQCVSIWRHKVIEIVDGAKKFTKCGSCACQLCISNRQKWRQSFAFIVAVNAHFNGYVMLIKGIFLCECC